MMGYVTIQASDNPLVNFMWIGAVLMVLGAALAASMPGSRCNPDMSMNKSRVPR
jgi:cytochrome c biogenesis factor